MSQLTEKQLSEDWDFLKCIHSLLDEGNVLNTASDKPVVTFQFPNELQNSFDFTISNSGVGADELKEICRSIIKYSIKTNHRQFHNQLFGAVDPYGLAGSWITEALNTSQYTYEVGPVFTLMENEVIQMFCKLYGFENGDGIFAPGGSMSNMYGMVLARYNAVPNIKSKGCFNIKPLVAFTSDESHYSIKKAAHWLGIGTENLITVKTDAEGRMLASDLEKQIANVIKENRMPFFVNATAGTTVLGAFDNLNEIADVCAQYNLWLHVDACLGGSTVLSSKYKHLIAGMHRVNSLAWNPHKSLGVPLQCSMFLIKQKGHLHECNSTTAHYLFQQDKFYDTSYDTGNKSVQCGRKVDVFKFWLMLKARGIDQFTNLIENSIEKSQYLNQLVNKREGFRSIQTEDFQFTNVCFWYIPKSIRNREENYDWWAKLYTVAPKIKERMVRRGSLMVSYSPLPCKNKGNFFRMSLACFPPARYEDIDFLVDEIERLGEDQGTAVSTNFSVQ